MSSRRGISTCACACACACVWVWVWVYAGFRLRWCIPCLLAVRASFPFPGLRVLVCEAEGFGEGNGVGELDLPLTVAGEFSREIRIDGSVTGEVCRVGE